MVRCRHAARLFNLQILDRVWGWYMIGLAILKYILSSPVFHISIIHLVHSIESFQQCIKSTDVSSGWFLECSRDITNNVIMFLLSSFKILKDSLNFEEYPSIISGKAFYFSEVHIIGEILNIFENEEKNSSNWLTSVGFKQRAKRSSRHVKCII